jgi:hypothetical protein
MKVLDKIFSGRYFLTVCAGVAFVWLAVLGRLSAETVSMIIVIIIKDYFTKKD